MNFDEKNIEKYKNIPKIIWILWFQGIDSTPHVVTKCINSWRLHNSSWKIVFLDENNYTDYIDISNIIGKNKNYITRTYLSDIVRINLLNNYGGVWVDSTCYCTQPLEKWVDRYIENDFFMFHSPSKHSPISSWFIISSKNSKITNILTKEINAYCAYTSFSNQNKPLYAFINKIIERIMFRNSYKSRLFEVLFNLTKLLKVYPYFCFHYTFAFTLKKDNEFKQEWDKVKYFTSDKPHNLQHYGLFKIPSESLKEEMSKAEIPLYKLTWKYDEKLYFDGCSLDYLLEEKNKITKGKL
jgi:hypothetical protein